MIKNYLWIFLLLNASLLQAQIYPEDGSSLLGTWNFGTKSLMLKNQGFAQAAEKEGIELRRVPFDYEYFQDISVWGDDGRLFIMAPMPADDRIMGNNITRGVMDDEDGFWRLTYLQAQVAERAGIPFKKMKWTFFEGGNAISGRFANGDTYIILENGALERTRNYYFWKTKIEISDEEAKELIAQDLEIKAENVFSVDMYQHLDLYMVALPGGRILLHDPLKALDALKLALQDDENSQEEQKRLLELIDYHENGRKPYSWSSYIERHYSDTLLSFLNKIEADLKDRFEVKRVAGIFDERTNFFNAFLGKNSHAKTFFITNHARGLKALERHWADLLREEGFEREHVHFVGGYGYGAGIDCAGAPAGKAI